MSLTPPSDYEKGVLGFASECLSEGNAFLQAAPGFSKIQETIDAINGEWHGADARPFSTSPLTLNNFGKIALDMKAALTDVKPFWDYRSSNPLYQQQAQMSNKLAQSWYVNRQISMRMADTIGYALAAGTGYPHLVYDPEINDMNVIPEDPRDVIPIRPASFISIQDAFGVVIRRERTVNWVRARYPYKASRIQADRDGSAAALQSQGRTNRLMESLGLSSGFMSNLYSSLGGKPKAADLKIPTVDVFTMYLKDDTVATSDVWMGLIDGPNGKQKTNWSYFVKAGQRMYPRKRCIVFTRSAVLYDDTSIYWHGLFPTPKLTLDSWPWLWLGKSPLKDLLPIHSELNRMMRIVSQHYARVERPGLAGDKNSISQAAMDKIDTSRPGLKLRHNPIAGKGIELLHEPPLDQHASVWIQFLIDQEDSLSGRRDLTNLMNLGQVPAMETVEKILETMSPSIRLRSQAMEAFMVEFAKMLQMNFFQFYTTAQRVAVLGPSQGMTFEDFDFDPDTLIPDMVESMGRDDAGNPLPRHERAKVFIDFFKFQIAPGSLLASSGVQDKLMFMNLAKAGVVDVWSLAEKLGIPNYGTPPDGSIPDRLVAQQQMGIGMNASSAGRKQSDQSMPRITMKTS